MTPLIPASIDLDQTYVRQRTENSGEKQDKRNQGDVQTRLILACESAPPKPPVPGTPAGKRPAKS
jgi:hypothetical protein